VAYVRDVIYVTYVAYVRDVIYATYVAYVRDVPAASMSTLNIKKTYPTLLFSCSPVKKRSMPRQKKKHASSKKKHAPVGQFG